MTLKVLSYAELNEGNPCVGCPAPCCRIQLFPLEVPKSFLDLDYIRFLLLFPATECVVSTTGEWAIVKWADCRELHPGACTCKVHGTPAQPRICSQYNAHDCWYRRNFVTGEPPDVYRLDHRRFEVWVESLGFDDSRRIVAAPSFEESQALLAGLAIEPSFALDPQLTKTAPPAAEPERTAAAVRGLEEPRPGGRR